MKKPLFYLIPLLLILGIGVFIQSRQERQVPSKTSISWDIPAGDVPANSSFHVRLKKNGNNAIEIAALSMSFDPAVLTVASCKPSKGFTSIDERNCTVENGTLNLFIEADEETAQSDELADIEFQANAPGNTPLTITTSEIIGEDADGNPIDIDVVTTKTLITVN